jgi:hypothetical protein
MGMVEARAHQIGRTKSATRQRIVKVIQNIFRSMCSDGLECNSGGRARQILGRANVVLVVCPLSTGICNLKIGQGR